MRLIGRGNGVEVIELLSVGRALDDKVTIVLFQEGRPTHRDGAHLRQDSLIGSPGHRQGSWNIQDHIITYPFVLGHPLVDIEAVVVGDTWMSPIAVIRGAVGVYPAAMTRYG